MDSFSCSFTDAFDVLDEHRLARDDYHPSSVLGSPPAGDWWVRSTHPPAVWWVAGGSVELLVSPFDTFLQSTE